MQDPPDDRILDEIVDHALQAVTEGRDVDLDQVCAGRPDLRGQAEALLELVRETAPWGGTALPAVAGYRILRQLGRGGMGTVHLAEQVALGRHVALKLLPAVSALSTAARTRFRNEARALAAVRHPHVVAVHEIVETPTLCAYAMEWIEGRNLAQAIAERGFGAREVATLGAALARALEAVHAQGIVHRDVKPSNVLLRANGAPVLSDFGLARDASTESMTVTGNFLGTRAFAAPEQLRGAWDAVDARSDVYSLGATLRAALGAMPPERDLATILAMATAEEPASRYASARAFADDLERFLSERPILARPTPVLTRVRKLVRRHRGTLGLALVSSSAAVVLAGVLGWKLWQAHTAPERIAAALTEARLLLLEPTHEERLERAAVAMAPTISPRFAQDPAAALARYDAALERGAGPEVAAEREVVALAAELARGTAATPSAALRSRCPATAAALAAARPGADAARAGTGSDALDRRLAGLFHFLTGNVHAAHAAWESTSLDEDPFVAAATGQLLRSELEFARALPRFLTAARAFPEARFLQIALAECLLEVGDVREAAARLRAVGDGNAEDPFRIASRLRARLLAREGRRDEARALFELALHEHSSTRTRIDFARFLAEEGDLEGAMEHASVAGCALDAQRKDRETAVGIADRWWRSRLPLRQAHELAAALHLADLRQSRLGRIARILEASPTLRTTPSSLDSMPSRPAGVFAALEFLAMKSSFPRGFSPRTSRILAGTAIALLAQGTATLPLLGLALASGLTTGIRAQAGWVQRTPATQPDGRIYMMMTHDSNRGRSVLFGGQLCFNCAPLGDTWEWNGTTWSLAATTGPSPRSLYGIAFDSLRNRTILFGGSASTGNSSETWSWDGTTWTQLLPPLSPSARWSFDMCYDSARDRIVLFGGAVAGGNSNETWEWDGSTWILHAPANKPSARNGHRMVYDSVRKRVVLFGGGIYPALNQDTWEWDGTNWQQIPTPSRPAARFIHMMAFDGARNRTVVFGGWVGSSLPDVWEYDGTTWTIRGGTNPAARNGGAMTFDSTRGRLVLFSGGPELVAYRDTWEFFTPSPATVVPYGAACPSSAGAAAMGTTTPAPFPYLGDTFAVTMQPVPSGFFNQPFFLLGNSDQLWETTPLPLALDPLGMPNCTLLTNPLVTLNGARTGSVASLGLTIPNVPAFAGVTLYLQGGVVDQAANALGIAMANALRFRIGVR